MLLNVVKSNLKKVDIPGVMTVLYILAESFQSIKSSSLYIDIPGFSSPCALAGDSLHPDLLLVISDTCLYFLELAFCFEANLTTNSHW